MYHFIKHIPGTLEADLSAPILAHLNTSPTEQSRFLKTNQIHTFPAPQNPRTHTLATQPQPPRSHHSRCSAEKAIYVNAHSSRRKFKFSSGHPLSRDSIIAKVRARAAKSNENRASARSRGTCRGSDFNVRATARQR